MLINVVIPFHNEGKNIFFLINEINKVLKNLKYNYEFIFIDDGSSDNSLYIFKNTKKYFKYKLLKNKSKAGQTKCFKRCFRVCIGNYIIRMDSDLQDKPSDLKIFENYINKDFDLILGKRGKRKHNFLLKVASYVYDIIIKIFFVSSLKYSSGSFVAFKTKYIKNVNIKNNDHRYLPIICQLRGAKKNISVNITHRKRIYGKSKYNTLTKIIFGFFEVTNFIYRAKNGFFKKN